MWTHMFGWVRIASCGAWKYSHDSMKRFGCNKVEMFFFVCLFVSNELKVVRKTLEARKLATAYA